MIKRLTWEDDWSGAGVRLNNHQSFVFLSNEGGNHLRIDLCNLWEIDRCGSIHSVGVLVVTRGSHLVRGGGNEGSLEYTSFWSERGFKDKECEKCFSIAFFLIYKRGGGRCNPRRRVSSCRQSRGGAWRVCKISKEILCKLCKTVVGHVDDVIWCD